MMKFLSSIRKEKNFFKRYVSEARRIRRHCPSSFSLLEAVRFYPVWRSYLQRQGHALDYQIPWITLGATYLLEQVLRRDMFVFEYGSGGSTIFFAQRVSQVVSVEHDPKWAKKVELALADEGLTNCELYLVEPELRFQDSEKPSDVDSYVSSDERYAGQSFRQYVKIIEKYPNAFFDVILIDGRSRPSCFKHALPKVAEGGYIVLDNSDRPHYQSAIRMAPERYDLLDFPGPAPFLKGYTQTSIWKRTNA